jgi:hypothetical protein
LRATHEICDQHNDVATGSLIENWIHETERRTWIFGGHLVIQRVFQLLDYRGQMQYESIDKVATVARSRSVLAADPRRLLRWRLTRA